MRTPIPAIILLSAWLLSPPLLADDPATAPGGTAEHYSYGHFDITVVTAKDGHATATIKAPIEGEIHEIYHGPWDAPSDHTNAWKNVCSARLNKIENLFQLQGGEIDALWIKVQRVLQDQQWLAEDVDGQLLVLSHPKLCDPENPLLAPADALTKGIPPRGSVIDDNATQLLLKNFRDARDKLEQTLETDRRALKRLLTDRQEAILVREGVLK